MTVKTIEVRPLTTQQLLALGELKCRAHRAVHGDKLDANVTHGWTDEITAAYNKRLRSGLDVEVRDT